MSDSKVTLRSQGGALRTRAFSCCCHWRLQQVGHHVLSCRGRGTADVSGGWAQLIQGPRPRSVQWPRVVSSRARATQAAFSAQEQPNREDIRHTPVGEVTAAGELEAALTAFHSVDGPESRLCELL